ncbi:UNVERIFIED_CONTAM: hypothetical protein HDU68_002054 [Siphonaria sp. JEL0065]|nr:hypothetical protein HDU68_002054 [Siphonaria sp. JEL0065]
MTTVFVLGVSIASFFYASTYIHAAERLRKVTGISHAEALARKVLIRCILMSSGMLICYLPRMIVQLVFDSRTEYDSFATSIANVFASFDVVLTPGLILYFRPDVRATVLGKKGEESDSDEVDEEPRVEVQRMEPSSPK